MSKKIKTMIYFVSILWIVVFAQVIITKIYVKNNDVTQAFARNQLTIFEQSGELSEISQDGGWMMGKMAGKLSEEEKEKLADTLFAYEGGKSLFQNENGQYYVAYGYTNGIDILKKVNGKTINMNLAITYDEQEDKTMVYFGVPVLDVDF
jgi:hypothetical protein